MKQRKVRAAGACRTGLGSPSCPDRTGVVMGTVSVRQGGRVRVRWVCRLVLLAKGVDKRASGCQRGEREGGCR